MCEMPEWTEEICRREDSDLICLLPANRGECGARPDVQMANLTTEDNYRKNALAQYTGRRASCESSASAAVAAQPCNLKNSCGYSGGARRSDDQRHFDWCMTADAERPGQETLTRSIHIQQCK